MNSFPNTEDMRRAAPRLRTDRAKQAIALKPWITIPELDRLLISHQSSVISHQSSVISHQSSVISESPSAF